MALPAIVIGDRDPPLRPGPRGTAVRPPSTVGSVDPRGPALPLDRDGVPDGAGSRRGGLGVVLERAQRPDQVIGLDEPAGHPVGIVFSGPASTAIAGWLSAPSPRARGRTASRRVCEHLGADRALGFSRLTCWPVAPRSSGCALGVVLVGLFSFAGEPRRLQALADIAPPSRDCAYASNFTIASASAADGEVYGVVIDVGEASARADRVRADGRHRWPRGTLPMGTDQRARSTAAHEAGQTRWPARPAVRSRPSTRSPPPRGEAD